MTQAEKKKVILQASEWLIRLQEGALSVEEQQQLEAWRQQSPLHEKVWEKALQLQEKFADIPASVALPVMDKVQAANLSAYKKYLWLLAVVPALSALYYANEQQQWLADYRSAVGERKTIALPDGGKIILNGRSAIDVEYSDQERLIVLRKGEIWIETQPDALKRPFIVSTQQGTAQALGTKYLVKMDHDVSFVAVSEGAVKVTAKQTQQQHIINMGQQTYFDQHQIQNPTLIDHGHIAWTKGFLMVNDLPLKDFVQRLQPYQKGIIRLDPEIGEIRVSGVYPIDDMEKTYLMLAQTYNLKVDTYAVGYWKYIKRDQIN